VSVAPLHPAPARAMDRPPGPVVAASWRSRPGRAAVVVVMIVSLLSTAVLRQVTFDARESSSGPARSTRGNSLSRMDSYALALLLGGLRGPLVMVLWPNSENQKQQKDLDDLDTKIEWIRLLQAEFDTVHIFQIWNKAYNISVLRASLPNKYLTIIDALDYAHSVDQERPDDINIIQAIGGVYFDKLGSSQEKAYYRRRVMAESLPHRSPQKLSRDDPAWRRLDLDAVLDEKGNLLPALITPTLSSPLTDPFDAKQVYDGSELQFLKSLAPFPKGVSTLLFGYNYFKRAQILERRGERPAQLSERVVDSRPALALENWSTENHDNGRVAELRAFGLAVPEQVEDMDLITAGMLPDARPVDPHELDEAIDDYRESARAAQLAVDEFTEHLSVYPDDITLYDSHQEGLRAARLLVIADADYLELVRAPATKRRAMLVAVSEEYRQAARAYAFLILRFYTSDSVAAKVLPPGMTRPDLRKLNPALLLPTLARAQQEEAAEHRAIEYDAQDYLRYIERCERRALALRVAGNTAKSGVAAPQ
jgi:hypothetical protein